MSELQRLLTAYNAERLANKPCALATVVEVKGSAYRRPGARMLVTNDGRLTGTISGGCLEGDARIRAQQVMLRGKPEIIVYDSTDIEDDLEHGAQLGCQGEISILMEPIDYSNIDNPLELLRNTYRLTSQSVLATVLKSTATGVAPAQRLLLFNGNEFKGNLHTDLTGQLLPDMQLVSESSHSLVQEYTFKDGYVKVFLELIKPAPILSIYGAGNDVIPLTELATRLGWRVTVIDGRPSLATIQRFPKAEAVAVARLDELASFVNAASYAVLMSHNYHYDLAVLKQLAGLTAVSYIGILGPRKKTELLLNDLRQQGIGVDDLTAWIHSPIGLDIGGENADEIALSIMAELMAVKNGLKGGFLRDLDAPIHNRQAATQPSFNEQ